MSRTSDETALIEAREALETRWSDVGRMLDVQREGLERLGLTSGPSRWRKWAPVLVLATAAGFALGARVRRPLKQRRRG